ncbi:MAG: hypothetical protein VYE68_01890 [Acidobacteriota bacterium]|nr:hypothetical protein [Acidobacteriota bacterium]
MHSTNVSTPARTDVVVHEGWLTGTIDGSAHLISTLAVHSVILELPDLWWTGQLPGELGGFDTGLGVVAGTMVGLGECLPTEAMDWAAPPFQAAAAGDDERAARLWLATPLMTTDGRPDAAATTVEVVMGNTRLFSYGANPGQPFDPPVIERLSEITCPTLIMTSGQDMAQIKNVANILATSISTAELVPVPSIGHLVNRCARGCRSGTTGVSPDSGLTEMGAPVRPPGRA